jgi:dipeptidyl aminopeptidase/acylaminoacyl peptidase
MDTETIKTAEKFNPANFVNKWHTPHLIIHGSKDYRLPETDGLAAFTALQLFVVVLRKSFMILD